LDSKKSIIEWYRRAKEILNRRRAGLHHTTEMKRLSEADFAAYTWSVEDCFRRLKKKFNEELAKKCHE
jgi:hypothetical protein